MIMTIFVDFPLKENAVSGTEDSSAHNNSPINHLVDSAGVFEST